MSKEDIAKFLRSAEGKRILMDTINNLQNSGQLHSDPRIGRLEREIRQLKEDLDFASGD